MMDRRRERGFTIIEVMIVVMIIGILASILIPTVKGYTLRSKVSEAILAFGTCRNTVTDIVLSGGSFPLQDEWGCEANTSSNPSQQPSQYVKSVSVDGNGVIKIWVIGTGSALVDNFDVTMAPLDNAGSPVTEGGAVSRWRCGSPADGTTLNLNYLPSSCRGG
jgi:prepilin-type N-terminal cleavage/methylation domain-containing protein